MGLEDLTEGEKESFNEIDEDDVEEFRDKVDELTRKITQLSKIAVNVDGRMEGIRDDMEVIEARLRNVESIVLEQQEKESEDEDLFEDVDGGDESPSWGE